MQFFHHKKRTGFTLIETMISVSIFAVVITMGIGSLMTIVSANKKLQVQRQTIDNMSFSLELMSRKIRTASMGTGGNFLVTTGNNNLSFRDQGGTPITYTVQGTTLVSIDSNGIITPLTPPNVQITDLKFIGSGLNPIGDGKAFLRINLVGNIVYKTTSTPFSLETSISPRLIDN